MGGPSIKNGIIRAIKEIALPSIFVLLSVFYVSNKWGEMMAGIVFVILTAIALYFIYTSANYWTTTYTAGFVITGIIAVLIVPDIVTPLIHPVFNYIGTAVVIIFLIFMLKLFGLKLGILKK